MFYKSEYRNRILTKRQQLTKITIQKAAKAVAVQVINLNLFKQAKKIASYIATSGELDPYPIILATQSQKKIYLPAVIKNTKQLNFLEFENIQTLMPNHFNILEPPPHQPTIAAQDLDCVLIPLVGFDTKGNRLGRGAGYYDATFSFRRDSATKKPLLIGLGYEFQKIPEISRDEWDVSLDLIVTEKTIYTI